MPNSEHLVAIPSRLDTPGFRKIIEIIVRVADPERIVLFGSRARGDARPDSDYDLAIYKKGIGNERLLTGQVYRSLYSDGPMESVDLLAFDMDRTSTTWNRPGTVRATIDTEGIVIYG